MENAAENLIDCIKNDTKKGKYWEVQEEIRKEIFGE